MRPAIILLFVKGQDVFCHQHTFCCRKQAVRKCVLGDFCKISTKSRIEQNVTNTFGVIFAER
jgi:hypothetical protein